MTTTPNTFAVGDHAETIIAAPHPAAYSGTITAVGELLDGTPMVRITDAAGVSRNYTAAAIKRPVQ